MKVKLMQVVDIRYEEVTLQHASAPHTVRV